VPGCLRLGGRQRTDVLRARPMRLTAPPAPTWKPSRMCLLKKRPAPAADTPTSQKEISRPYSLGGGGGLGVMGGREGLCSTGAARLPRGGPPTSLWVSQPLLPASSSPPSCYAPHSSPPPEKVQQQHPQVGLERRCRVLRAAAAAPLRAAAAAAAAAAGTPLAARMGFEGGGDHGYQRVGADAAGVDLVQLPLVQEHLGGGAAGCARGGGRRGHRTAVAGGGGAREAAGWQHLPTLARPRQTCLERQRERLQRAPLVQHARDLGRRRRAVGDLPRHVKLKSGRYHLEFYDGHACG
jgi:hypothetical protein